MRVWPLILLAACAATRAADEAAIAQVLDDFHDAASKADGARYFGYFDPDGVFLGTDASERWTLEEFKAYAQPYFSKGKGWTYQPRARHIMIDRHVAWFDEMLDNQSYGELRGTGVLRKRGGIWRLVQYNLAFTVPNDAAADVVRRIRSGP